ncbi:MAG: hypothetical protein ACJ79E_14140 [Anaeromyxobacteraceae bacterium]
MFWKDEPIALNTKKKVLVVACAASALVGVGCVILSVRGSFEATIAAMLAVFAAAATGNWVHWASKDANKLARDMGTASAREHS